MKRSYLDRGAHAGDCSHGISAHALLGKLGCEPIKPEGPFFCFLAESSHPLPAPEVAEVPTPDRAVDADTMASSRKIDPMATSGKHRWPGLLNAAGPAASVRQKGFGLQ